LSDDLLNSQLIAQNLEVNQACYTLPVKKVVPYLPYKPEFILSNTKGKITAVNMGIVGGHDISFFKQYTNFIYEFIKMKLSKVLEGI